MTTACDWRGYEHEQKVKAAKEGAAATQVAVAQDAFDKLCTKDAAACWQELVQRSHTAAVGPAKGTTGVTQVCCEIPATAVSTDHSEPAGFNLAVDGGNINIGSIAGDGKPTFDSTVRGLPAQVVARTNAETVRWVEAGRTYVALAHGLTPEQVTAALGALVLYKPS